MILGSSASDVRAKPPTMPNCGGPAHKWFAGWPSRSPQCAAKLRHSLVEAYHHTCSENGPSLRSVLRFLEAKPLIDVSEGSMVTGPMFFRTLLSSAGAAANMNETLRGRSSYPAANR